MRLSTAAESIFKKENRFYQNGITYFPLTGSGEHRSMRALENKGLVRIVSIQPHVSGNWYSNSFVRIEDGYRLNQYRDCAWYDQYYTIDEDYC